MNKVQVRWSIGLLLATFAVIFSSTWVLSEGLTEVTGVSFPFTDNQARGIFIPCLITGIVLFLKYDKKGKANG